MVEGVFAECAALQGPSGTAAASELDEERGFHRDRIKAVDAADVRLVEWYSTANLTDDGSILTPYEHQILETIISVGRITKM